MRRRLGVAGAVGAVAAVTALGAACTASAGGPVAREAARAPAPALVRFDSCDRFLGHVRTRALQVVGPWGLGAARPVADVALPARSGREAPAPAAGAPAPREGVDYSGTNLQEAGVDEPDIVKTDGRTVFALSGGTVRAVDVTGAAPRGLGPGFTPDSMSPSGLVLSGNRLVVIGDGAVPYSGPGPIVVGGDRAAASPIAPTFVSTTVLVELDVSDPARLRVVSRMTVDGRLVSARRADGTLRVVLSTSPDRIPLTLPATGSAAAERAAALANRRAVRRARAAAWLPRLKVRDAATGTVSRRPAVRCGSVSRPSRFAGMGMLTVLTLDVPGDLRVLDSDAVMSDGELVYASPEAMYVATPRWADPSTADDAVPPRGATLIHKLDTSDPARTTYVGSGAVRGYLLNQFSMSEHKGNLRVASTEEPDWWSAPEGDARPSESVVTVLGQRDGRLARLGLVDGIGKGERIYAVRFLGDRGYVVTFRQTDPLFTLDLSDPARPRVSGELKIPGFSSYLHPVDDTLLIGIGQDATDQGRTLGTQVSLFDVSDPAAPRRIAQRALDTDWSEAESDHHAVLYWPATRLLVLPVQDWSELRSSTFLGAVGLNVARDTGITPIARVRHPDGGAESGSPVRRSLVVGSALYTVSETGIMASELTTLAPRGWLAFD